MRRFLFIQLWNIATYICIRGPQRMNRNNLLMENVWLDCYELWNKHTFMRIDRIKIRTDDVHMSCHMLTRVPALRHACCPPEAQVQRFEQSLIHRWHQLNESPDSVNALVEVCFLFWPLAPDRVILYYIWVLGSTASWLCCGVFWWVYDGKSPANLLKTFQVQYKEL